jgi:hypothetical protein
MYSFSGRKSKNGSRQRYWEPGDELTERDLELLEPLRRRARELGYTPTQADMPDITAIKSRFRVWRDAVAAAGLPWLNTPEQQRRRSEARKQNMN